MRESIMTELGQSVGVRAHYPTLILGTIFMLFSSEWRLVAAAGSMRVFRIPKLKK